MARERMCPILPGGNLAVSCSPNDIEYVARYFVGIYVLDKVVKCTLQGAVAKSLLNVTGWSGSEHRATTEYQQVGADALNYFQHVGTVEDRFSLLAQRTDQVFED